MRGPPRRNRAPKRRPTPPALIGCRHQTASKEPLISRRYITTQRQKSYQRGESVLSSRVVIAIRRTCTTAHPDGTHRRRWQRGTIAIVSPKSRQRPSRTRRALITCTYPTNRQRRHDSPRAYRPNDASRYPYRAGYACGHATGSAAIRPPTITRSGISITEPPAPIRLISIATRADRARCHRNQGNPSTNKRIRITHTSTISRVKQRQPGPFWPPPIMPRSSPDIPFRPHSVIQLVGLQITADPLSAERLATGHTPDARPNPLNLNLGISSRPHSASKRLNRQKIRHIHTLSPTKSTRDTPFWDTLWYVSRIPALINRVTLWRVSRTPAFRTRLPQTRP